MTLTIGDGLGRYDVTALIGERGMDQVCRATDTQLGRDVALKILPDAFAAGPVPAGREGPRQSQPPAPRDDGRYLSPLEAQPPSP